MELKKKIGQRLMVGINGYHLDQVTRDHLYALTPGSIILFSRNIRDRKQVKGLIKELKDTITPPPLIAIDQEGGLVVRFHADITVMPGNMALGATGSSDFAFRQGVSSARELKEIGVDINLSPVVDVVTGYENPGITVRSFGANPEHVAALGTSIVLGTQSQGVAAVAKHLPGKGSATKDAHFDLPRVEDPWNVLAETHLYPFHKCISAGVCGIMSSHVLYSHFPQAENAPATFSYETIQRHLRGNMGFNGVIFSDDMEMGAIARFFPFEQAIVKAARAGHDMILVCSDYERQRRAFHALFETHRKDQDNIEALNSSVKRIAHLRMWCAQRREVLSEGEEETPASVARKIAENSISVIQGHAPVPVPPGKFKRITAIIPDLCTLESVEEGFERGDTNVLKQGLESGLSDPVSAEFITIDGKENEIEQVLRRASAADLVLAFIFNARYTIGQRLLVTQLKLLSVPTVFVLIRNPFDLDLLEPQHTAIVTYGYRKVQLLAAVDVLCGKIQARGTIPFNLHRRG